MGPTQAHFSATTDGVVYAITADDTLDAVLTNAALRLGMQLRCVGSPNDLLGLLSSGAPRPMAMLVHNESLTRQDQMIMALISAFAPGAPVIPLDLDDTRGGASTPTSALTQMMWPLASPSSFGHIANQDITGGIKPLSEVERDAIEHAIRLCDGNIQQAARMLDIAPSTIYRKRMAWTDDHSVTTTSN